MKGKPLSVLLSVVLTGAFSHAYSACTGAPVVDLSRAEQSDASLSSSLEVDQEEPASRPVQNQSHQQNHQHEPIDQRVLRLERQMANLNETNSAGKLEKLQQELQLLHGQVEVQGHDLAQLKEQVNNFYRDLDQRLTKKNPISENSLLEKDLSCMDKGDDIKSNDINSDPEINKTKELQTYETAFNLLNRKEYSKAISSFQNFIKSYPASPYAINAHYWLGEIYYLKNKPDMANKEFQTIVNDYPESTKVSDALLKVALIAMDGGNYSKAKQNFQKVQKQYPGTTAAKIAALRLKEIKQKR
jgi:tol-pal system protein YbgF